MTVVILIGNNDNKLSQQDRQLRIVGTNMFGPMCEQGFITDDGQFLNRYQAGAYACEHHGLEIRHDNLNSEHLW